MVRFGHFLANSNYGGGSSVGVSHDWAVDKDRLEATVDQR